MMDFARLFSIDGLIPHGMSVSRVMENLTIWLSMYWLSCGITVITAIASLMTAILLVGVAPAVLRFSTRHRVIELNASLEARVAERALELAAANQTLLAMNADLSIASAERKRADDQFRLALEAAPTGMLMMNEAGTIVLVNAQIEALFGYRREELLGQCLEMLVPLRYRANHPHLRTMFFGDPKTRVMGAGRELYGLRKDGTEVPIAIGLNPLQTSEGHFVLSSIADISERKRADEQFRLALEAAPTGMLMMSETGAIVLVNKQIEALFGYRREELLGQGIEMLVPERYRDDHPHLRTMFFGDPKTRAMGAGRELYGLRKDGTEVPIEIGLNPLQTSEGRFVLSSIADITERKRAQEGLHALNAELELRVSARTAELKERESLLQEIHHRVKNNLQVVSSLINMQIRGLEDASSQAALRQCQSRVMTMAQIHEMLYQSANYARVPFAKYAEDLTTRILSASGTSPGNVTLHFDLDEVSLPVAQAIPCGLILNELVTNSLKHAFPNGAHGTIRVALRLAGDKLVTLSVADDGTGISPELDLATLTSLGVQLVITLVEQLEGHFEVIRLPGSTFNISFPLELHA